MSYYPRGQTENGLRPKSMTIIGMVNFVKSYFTLPPAPHRSGEPVVQARSMKFQWPNIAFVFCVSTGYISYHHIYTASTVSLVGCDVCNNCVLYTTHPIITFHSFMQSSPKSLDLPLSCMCILKTTMQLGVAKVESTRIIDAFHKRLGHLLYPAYQVIFLS